MMVFLAYLVTLPKDQDKHARSKSHSIVLFRDPISLIVNIILLVRTPIENLPENHPHTDEYTAVHSNTVANCMFNFSVLFTMCTTCSWANFNPCMITSVAFSI